MPIIGKGRKSLHYAKGVSSTQIGYGEIDQSIIDIDLISGTSASHDTLVSAKATKAYIDTITGNSLSTLTDTAITSPGDASLLLYDTGTSRWRDGVMSGDATLSDTGVISIASGVIVDADVNASAAIAISKTALVAGTGITLSTNTLNVDAAQTGITSILATDVKIGEDDQTKIDFETANTIHFYAGNENQLILTDGYLTPSSNGIVDLGTDALEFNNAFFDGTVEMDVLSLGGTVVSSTAAELNLLAGVSGLVQADLTKLAAVDSTAAEINLLNGVSGLVQADLTKLAAIDATATEINLLDALDRGSILYGNSSGVTAVLGQGGANTVLTSDGTDISWAAVPGATTVTINANNTTDETVYPVFADGATGSQELESDTGLTYNPSTGVLTATTFSGAFTGTVTDASHITITDNESTNENNLIPFVEDAASSTGNHGLEMDGDFHYNPSTGRLTATQLAGTLQTAAQTNITSVGALDAGSITSGFTSIDVGSGAITTTGTITAGNLTVNGTTTTVNSTTVTIDDPIFTLGGDSAPGSDDNKDRGIEFRWHNGSAAKVGFFGYDDSAGKFTFIPDATNNSEVFSGTAGTIVANLEGNASGTAATVTGAAQSAITSLGTLTTLTVDNVIINGTTIGHTDDTDLITLADGVATVAGELDATSLDISGDADIDGTLEADAITVDGTALNEYIADTVGAMVTSNTESGITVAYQDGDNTLDFTVGTLNQDTTGNSATATALETARTIGGTSFNGSADIVPATITVADTTDTSSYVALFESATGDLAPKTDAGITYNAGTGMLTATGFTGPVTGNASTATALASGRTIGMTGDVVWTSASFDGSGNVTGSAVIQATSVENSMLAGSIADSKLNTISTAGKVDLAALEIDGGTDIGEALVDADLFIVDNGAGGTNRKMAASRIKTYIGAADEGFAIAMSIAL